MRELQKMGYRNVGEVEKLLKNKNLATNADCDINAKKKTKSLTNKDEKQIEEILGKALLSCNPNPERNDCSDPALIRDLAFHKDLQPAWPSVLNALRMLCAM
jgi:hypothetical protein